MVELSQEQRRVMVDKLPDMANVAAGAMVFGQFIGDRPFSITVAAAGVAAWVALGGIVFLLSRRRES